MEYCELKVFIKMKKDMAAELAYETISKLINKSLLNDTKLKAVHEKNCFKMYTYGCPTPIEKERKYLKDRLYSFNVRSINNELIARIGRVLAEDTEYFKVEGKSYEGYKADNIKKLVTLTPVVVTMPEGKYWCEKDGIEELIHRLSYNAVRKVQEYFNTEEGDKDHIFIDSIVQKNKRLIMVPYKGGYLYGNKFEINIKDDAYSQKLAAMVAAVGIGEKASVGCGYCKVVRASTTEGK